MNILIKPIITEKATNDSELNNRYTFQVNVKSNKVEIKKAVEKAYGVSVEKVRTIMFVQTGILVTQRQVSKMVKQMLLRRQLYNWRKVSL